MTTTPTTRTTRMGDRDIPVRLGLYAVAAGAAAASFDTMLGAVQSTGWTTWTSYIIPGVVDVTGLLGGRVWLRRHPTASEARRYGRRLCTAALAVTLAGNVTGHTVAAGLLQPGIALVVVCSLVAPLALFGMLHLDALLAPDWTGHGTGTANSTGTDTAVANQTGTGTATDGDQAATDPHPSINSGPSTDTGTARTATPTGTGTTSGTSGTPVQIRPADAAAGGADHQPPTIPAPLRPSAPIGTPDDPSATPEGRIAQNGAQHTMSTAPRSSTSTTGTGTAPGTGTGETAPTPVPGTEPAAPVQPALSDDDVIARIRELDAENNGVPVGPKRIRSATGIGTGRAIRLSRIARETNPHAVNGSD